VLLGIGLHINKMRDGYDALPAIAKGVDILSCVLGTSLVSGQAQILRLAFTREVLRFP